MGPRRSFPLSRGQHPPAWSSLPRPDPAPGGSSSWTSVPFSVAWEVTLSAHDAHRCVCVCDAEAMMAFGRTQGISASLLREMQVAHDTH